MKLMDRDTQIIEFITENKGATIEQIHQMFFPSYDSAANRLKILFDNKFFNVGIHPILGKKVYYIKKMPSYHTLVFTDILVMLKDKYKSYKREYKINKYITDGIIILKSGKLLIIEVDIQNKTSDKKINDIQITLAGSKIVYEMWIICKCERRSKARGVRFLRVGDKVENV